MKRAFFAGVTLLVSLTAATLVLAHFGPKEITMTGKDAKAMGPVLFLHHDHQDATNNDCTVCHHTAKAGETALKSCCQGHGKVAGLSTNKDALHQSCKGCHKESKAAGKDAPTSCKGCHVK